MPGFTYDAQRTYLERAYTLIEKFNTSPPNNAHNIKVALQVYANSKAEVTDVKTLKRALSDNHASAQLIDGIDKLTFRTTVFLRLIEAEFEIKDNSIFTRELQVHELLDTFIFGKRTKQDATHVKKELDASLDRCIEHYKNIGKPSMKEKAISALKKLGAALLSLVSCFTVFCSKTYGNAIQQTLFAKPETAFSRENGPKVRALNNDLIAHVDEYVVSYGM